MPRDLISAHHGIPTLHRKCDGFLPNKFLHYELAECKVVTDIMNVRLVISMVFRNAFSGFSEIGVKIKGDGKGFAFS